MLEPNRRRLLLESLQPPPGFKVDLAIGTTYTLDLIALLSAPVAFAFSDAQDRDGNPLLEPLALLKATREYASRMLLFCQAGKIQVPNAYQSLFSQMEGSIAEALAPKNGSFHPKVQVLRFVRDEFSTTEHDDPDEVRYRFLCMSRNLTFDRSWDISICLDGVLKNRKRAFSTNHPLGDFLKALPMMVPRGVSNEWKQRIEKMALEVRRVEFELPFGFERFSFWPIGLSENNDWPVGENLGRLLIISPFVDEKLLAGFQKTSKEVQVISRPDQLGQLSSELLAKFDGVWTLDDAAKPDTTAEEATENESTFSSNDAHELGKLSGLHAKLFVSQYGNNVRIVAGSANATNAAFTKNVEFMTIFDGTKKYCGIDKILGTETEGKPVRQVSCLGDMLVPFKFHEGDEVADATERAFELTVDDFSKQVAACVLGARCEQISDSQEYRVVLYQKERATAVLPGCTVTARPISLPKERWFAVDTTAKDWMACEPVSLLGLTSFFAFKVEERSTGMVRQFAVNAPLDNAPSHRDDAILNAILSDSDRVQRFLLLLLGDASTARKLLFDELLSEVSSDNDRLQANRGALGVSLFETLMKTLSTAPDRLKYTAQIIEDLRKTEAGASKLPDGFETIWDPIYAAWQQKYNKPKRTRKIADA